MQKIKLKLQEILDNDNLAELLTPEQREELAMRCVDDFSSDFRNQEKWIDRSNKYLKMADCDVSVRKVRWQGAANACIPLMANACLASASRLYAELLRTFSPVNVAVVKSHESQLADISQALDTDLEAVQLIKKHITYQLKLNPDCNWQEDLFTCCYLYYVTGLVARYKYYDEELGAYKFRTLWPGEWCMSGGDYNPKFGRFSFCSEMSIAEIQEKIVNDTFVNYKDGIVDEHDDNPDWSSCRKVIHQFFRKDLDGDGYPEPYCAIIDEERNHLLKLTKNFYIDISIIEDEEGIPQYSSDQVEFDDKGVAKRLKKVDPIPYVTIFKMYPSARSPDDEDENYYYGLGHLLYDLNKRQNNLTNQMLDIGTLQARQGAFIDQRARLPGGTRTISMNESIFVKPPPNTNLRDSIIPFPRNDISPVQFNLLEYLTKLGQETGNITEIMSGQVPDNTSPLIGMAAIQNSLLPFKTTYRLFLNGYSEEFRGISLMNYIYVPDEEFMDLEQNTLPVSKELYNPGLITIQPTADPVISSDAERLSQQMILDTMIDRPEVNDREILLNKCKTSNIEDAERFIPPPDPNPPTPPEIEQMKVNMQFVKDESDRKWKELELKNMELMRKQEELRHKMAMDQAKSGRETNKEITEAMLRESTTLKNIAIAEAQEKGSQLEQYKAETERLEAESDERARKSGIDGDAESPEA